MRTLKIRTAKILIYFAKEERREITAYNEKEQLFPDFNEFQDFNEVFQNCPYNSPKVIKEWIFQVHLRKTRSKYEWINIKVKILINKDKLILSINYLSI